LGRYRRNHYVPQWFQYRFLSENQKENKFFYLDLKPEVKLAPNGKKYTRKSVLKWGPPRCFYEDDLYTTKFPGFESTEIEEKFFGSVDSKGKEAVEYFSTFEHPSVGQEQFHSFLQYASVQKIRTPKGLEYLRSLTRSNSKNQLLYDMQKFHQMHCALWSECVWSIVDASKSSTKFLLSDNPITVYNQGCYPE
jgi:chromosome condensin MukBEF MukE localization factor